METEKTRELEPMITLQTANSSCDLVRHGSDTSVEHVLVCD
jgi:hypothetical protein